MHNSTKMLNTPNFRNNSLHVCTVSDGAVFCGESEESTGVVRDSLGRPVYATDSLQTGV